ncbi:MULTISPECIES: LysR family transcriptional regulator [Ramlibacter]|uniref:LysR family transcriptional regulator n=1 Tax=Ramlibacter pinisoli TaxID=2682844 RepID=A0A6N8IT37_9BURK|nr:MULTISPECIES: LysR family transcriptional regulator [Ramlibacter]MBA2965033.1 LysR family transcriptional regulator [Ramlibacter sp. CGMCC 1.13660]MVQ29998.1 LysR family transcriptional regulator [Ramlibacter pinisoli]
MNLTDEQLRPDWELLASWVAVMETGSVSDAARLLRISQAAVSQRIKQLETIFSTPLLDRSTRPAQPTAAGQRLFENAKDLLTRSDQMMESVRNVSRAKRMIVRFGCVDSFAATIGPLLIKALASSSHQIRLWSGITPTLDAQIEGRQLDLAVTTSVMSLPGISREQLFTEAYYAVLPASFEVSKFGSLLDLSRHLQFIRYSARSVIGQQVDEYLQRTGDALERTCEFDATDPLLSLVASGMGFALTTPLCIWQSRHFIPGIRVVPLSSFARQGRAYPDMTRTFFLAFRQGELGTLPTEVRDLVRIAVRRQLSPEIGTQLGLAKDMLWTPPET